MRLQTVESNAARALALPPFETPAWRRDFARGIRAALSASGARPPAYLRAALALLRADLAGTDLYEVSAPGESGNAKLAKNRAYTLAFTGASGADSGAFNPCPALGACADFCVLGATCGRARIAPEVIIGARARRLRAMRAHPVAAGARLAIDAARARRNADADGIARVVARLNVATDIGFESIPDIDALYARFSIDAYAYTKRPGAVRAARRNGGYTGRTRIVASWHEGIGEDFAAEYLSAGGTVAVVVAGLGVGAAARARLDTLRAMRVGGRMFPAVNGDETDDRTGDAPGSVIALAGKGPLASRRAEELDRADPAGFALRATDARLVWH
jgi:hypothetical protein